MSAAASIFGISVLGVYGENPKSDKIISLLGQEPDRPQSFPFLVSTHRVDNLHRADILEIKNSKDLKRIANLSELKGRGIRIELALSKSFDSYDPGKWLSEAIKIARDCKQHKFQFILSSGATSSSGLIPGITMDAVLRLCSIDPPDYWDELSTWVRYRIEKRIRI